MKIPVVAVEEIRKMDRGNLKAFVTVRIGPLTVRDFRIVQQPGQRAYVSAPQAEYEMNGQRRYKPLLEYPQEWKEAIQSAVLQAWEGAL